MSAATTPSREEVARAVRVGIEQALSALPVTDTQMAEVITDKLYALFTPAAESAGLREARDTAQSLVEAWASVFERIEAHLEDRVANSDEANPAAYLSLLRYGVADVLRDSVRVRAARWADYNRLSGRIEQLEAALATTEASPPSAGGGE